jgi:hypothetical protein
VRKSPWLCTKGLLHARTLCHEQRKENNGGDSKTESHKSTQDHVSC